MHYALPALLAREGLLDRLYTDIYSPAWLGRFPRAWLPGPLARLAGRTLPAGVAERTTAVPSLTLLAPLGSALRRLGFPPLWPSPDDRLIRCIIDQGPQTANALYLLSNAHLEAARAARAAGRFVVSEQMAHPHIGRAYAEERARFPGLEKEDPTWVIEDGILRDRELWSLADLVLAPSGWVRDAIVGHGIPASKVEVVPYGIGEEWLEGCPQPDPGRILYVGAVNLGKGVHYLAEAGRELRRRGVAHDIRVVGRIKPGLKERSEFRGPTYVGQVPRVRVRQEFLAADVFVLPTLTDSFALVHLEALASGVPVITTHACGSVVRDGVEGFIVPVRDARALAKRIEQLLTDRALRARMSEAARRRAAEFTWARYGERLLEVLGAHLGGARERRA